MLGYEADCSLLVAPRFRVLDRSAQIATVHAATPTAIPHRVCRLSRCLALGLSGVDVGWTEGEERALFRVGDVLPLR